MSFKRQKLESIPSALQKKWPGHLLDEGFVPFPKKFLRVLTDLYPESAAAKELAVILAIVDFRREGQTRFPSKEFLAYVAGMTVEDFDDTVAGLASKGWLTDQTATEDNKDFWLLGLEQAVLTTASHGA